MRKKLVVENKQKSVNIYKVGSIVVLYSRSGEYEIVAINDHSVLLTPKERKKYTKNKIIKEHLLTDIKRILD